MTSRTIAAAVEADAVALVDAIVAAIDVDRSWETDRVATALTALGLGELFTDELRLNGTGSAQTCECCVGEGWL